ncbi:ABC transporter ATP-binding protein [Atribacter laminatus]|uniref:Doxorubicin resistance ATP-binding protein DrrA n=1 Tax=Atribacter laminatus TaxID=2847778 RepID=A0A7T1F1H1_ATRLM|nr:ATP-binding cassette domain-containing protein [Atribacter laminatus]QPM66953.1 Doxorubicin resistance ATP-binding protein DrrA [Atribacter laminatus]
MIKGAPIIEVQNMTKYFGDIKAVDSVSFNIFKGELFGFLGPNGAGKTTTINILTGLARLDSGTIIINNIDCTHNPKAAQYLIGVVPDESNLYPELTGFENLCFCAALYGLGKVEREVRAQKLLEEFNLAEAGQRKFGTYSKGMKRKLTIAAGIIHHPQILFLDEPTTGIDVASARQIRQLIANLHSAGTTIFLTTHYIEEAERLCDRIAFIVSGKIVRINSVKNLLQPFKEKQIMEVSCSNTLISMIDELSHAFPELEFSFLNQSVIRVESNQPIRVGPLIRFLEDHGTEVTEARKIRPSLEDIFVKITGIEAGAMRKEKEKIEGGSQ